MLEAKTTVMTLLKCKARTALRVVKTRQDKEGRLIAINVEGRLAVRDQHRGERVELSTRIPASKHPSL
jgi:hypothetical protein